VQKKERKKTNKRQAASSKQCLTAGPGDDRMDLERNNMEKITIDYRVSEHMKRIADALEEILRLVKQDQEENKKRWAEREEN